MAGRGVEAGGEMVPEAGVLLITSIGPLESRRRMGARRPSLS